MDHDFFIAILGIFLGSLEVDFDNAIYKQVKSDKKVTFNAELEKLDKKYLSNVLLNRLQMLVKVDIDSAKSLAKRSIYFLFDSSTIRSELKLQLDRFELTDRSTFFDEVLRHAIEQEFKF